MPANNLLKQGQPHLVHQALLRLGSNLRTARLRRKRTVEQVAEQIGTGVRAVRNAESGNASTSIATYVALLWLYDLADPLAELADPSKDTEGLTLESRRRAVRARATGRLDDDF